MMFTERANGLPKRTLLLLAGLMALALICLTGCASTQYQSSYNDQAEIDDVQYLSSYGEWVYLPSFGTVWCPDVVMGWQPFYYGHWIWTSNEWAWASYEPYGWLVFHYGFWGYTPEIGWFWVPGDTWYPARVQWYTFGNYAGWAPIPPPGIVWLDPWDPYDVNVWIVIDVDNFESENVGGYRIERPISRGIVDGRTMLRRAPDVREIENATRRKVPVVEVREQQTNMRHRTVSVPPASSERVETRLRKMVLPSAEKRKVEKNASRVEKEVLTRRRGDAAPPKKASEEKRDTRKRE
jgi:hypothetical protein